MPASLVGSRYRSPVKRLRAADDQHWPGSTCRARGQSDSSVSVRVPVKRWGLLCRCDVARTLLAQGGSVSARTPCRYRGCRYLGTSIGKQSGGF
jgi:hypothetical protein